MTLIINNGGPKRKFTDEAKSLFKQLYIDERLSVKEVGEQLDCSYSTMYRYLKKFGILVRSKSDAQTGKILSKETKRRIGKASKERWEDEEYRERVSKKISKTLTGKKRPEEVRKRVSAGHQNIPLDEWKGYVSFKPYCPKFNYKKKEEIRNQYSRVCIVSGVSVLQNGRRLDVDHTDENKMQGCNGVKWRLVPLARDVHGKMNNQQNHLLLELLLLSNKRAEMNYEFGEKEK